MGKKQNFDNMKLIRQYAGGHSKLITLPLGVFDEDGTGKIRRIVNDSTAATETFYCASDTR